MRSKAKVIPYEPCLVAVKLKKAWDILELAPRLP